MTFLAARPFCSSQSRGCGCGGTARRIFAKMLSVRVAAAVARAFPRRAGLVSARNRWAGGGRVGGGVLIRELFLQTDRWWCADSGALSARRERGCSRRRHLAPLIARADWAGGGRAFLLSLWDGAECCRGDSDLDAVQRYGLRRISSSAGSGPQGGLGRRSEFGRLLSPACSETAGLGLLDFPVIPSVKVRASWGSLTLYEGQQAPAFHLCSEVGSKENSK